MTLPILRKTVFTFPADERGWVTPWSLFVVMMLLLFGGLSLDYANGVRKQAHLQAASDAAVLAAVLDLPDTSAATDAGMEIASFYFPDASDTNAIRSTDFIYGTWDKATDVFRPGAEPYNTVQVSAHRDQSRSNALSTYLLKLGGIRSLDVHASALAFAKSDKSCRNGGFFSEEWIISGSNNDYLDGFCLYGHDGVKIGSDNSFSTGARVIMKNDRNLEQSQNNRGIKEALIEGTYNLQLPGMVSTIVSDMKNGRFDKLPSFITKGPVTVSKMEKIKSLEPGTLYYVKDKADLSKFSHIKDVAFVSDKEVVIGGDTHVESGVFATMSKVETNSDVTFASDDYCGDGVYATYMFSGEEMTFGSNVTLRAIQMASRSEIKLGSDVKGMADVHAEARNNFDYGSADSYAGCADGLYSEFGVNPGKTTDGAYVGFALIR